MRLIELPKETQRRKNRLDRYIFSSRVRICRNLDGLKFPRFLSEKDKYDIDELLSVEISFVSEDIEMESLDQLSNDRIMSYACGKVITEEFIRNGRKFIFNISGEWVILLNEDDHLRIFSIETGYNIKKIYPRLIKIIESVEKKIDFSYDERWGYLSSSILNIGTGLRLSVTANLYGMVSTKKIIEFVDNSSGIGYAIENIGGEDSDSGLFYIYNVYSLGISEEKMTIEFDQFLSGLYEIEIRAREEFFSDPDELELSYEEIFELNSINLKSKNEIEWTALLYYISLLDAMNGLYFELNNIQAIRNLIFDATDDYLKVKYGVENEKIAEVRMGLLKKQITGIKYKVIK